MPSATDRIATAVQKNTGLAGLPDNLDRVRAIVFVPKGTIIATAAMATPTTTIEAKTLADNPASRWYVIGNIGEMTDNTTDTRRITWAFGYEESAGYGTYIMTFHPKTTDHRVIDHMQSFNNAENDFDVFLFTEDYKLVGTTHSTGLKALTTADIFTDARRMDAFENSKPGIRVVFNNTKELNDGNLYYWDTQIDIADSSTIARMNGIKLSQVTAINSSRIVDIKATVGGTNLATTAIASAFTQTGAWIGTNDTSGSAIAATAVAIVTVGGVKCFRVTYSNTNYPSSSGTFTVSNAVPSVLNGLSTSIEGYETVATLTQTAV